MKYQIILRGGDIKQIEIDEQEYLEITKLLNKSKLFRLKNGIIINAIDIKMIEPVSEQQTILKKFRLSENATITGKERDLKKIDLVKRMETLFNELKVKGMFKNFQTYNDWQKEIYKNEPYLIRTSGT